MYRRMAQVTFTLPLSDPLVTIPPIATPPSKFSWDTVFTIILVMCICLGIFMWVKFIENQLDRTPDGDPSSGPDAAGELENSSNNVDDKAIERAPYVSTRSETVSPS